MAHHDPLLSGFYTPAEAARLLRVDNSRRVSRWVVGHAHGDAVIAADHGMVAGRAALSFLDMMEVRFLEHFRKQGVSLQTLRRAVVRARAEMNTPHPFAASNLRFLTDRKTVFGHAAEDTKDKRTWDLVSSQYEMYEAIEDVLAKGVAFDPRSGLAKSFPPLLEFPTVTVNPRVSYGKPAVGESGIPTSALFRMWKAENGRKDRVARAYGIGEADVANAIGFEVTLAAA